MRTKMIKNETTKKEAAKDFGHGGDIYRNQVQYDFSVNVNLLGTPQAVIEAVRQNLTRLDVYPDGECMALCEALAKKHKKRAEQVLCGNGASELLMMLVQAYRPGKVLLPVPTFSEYERALSACGCQILYYNRDIHADKRGRRDLKKDEGETEKEHPDFSLTEDILSHITEELDMFILCEPLNPVGILDDVALLSKIAAKCRRSHCLLILDACFLPFTGRDKEVQEAVGEENVVWVRAFTKLYAMPGLRLGYLLCESEAEKRKIQKVQPAWSVSLLAQEAGLAALAQDAYVSDSYKILQQEREFLREGLEEMGFYVFPSCANFLLFCGDAKRRLYNQLLEQGILIRDCSNYRGLAAGYWRVAVKNHTENEILLAAIRRVTH